MTKPLTLEQEPRDLVRQLFIGSIDCQQVRRRPLHDPTQRDQLSRDLVPRRVTTKEGDATDLETMIGDYPGAATEVDAFRQLYNTWRPQEALGLTVPPVHYLAEPSSEPNVSEPESVQIS